MVALVVVVQQKEEGLALTTVLGVVEQLIRATMVAQVQLTMLVTLSAVAAVVLVAMERMLLLAVVVQVMAVQVRLLALQALR
jgi:hypothetical protein